MHPDSDLVIVQAKYNIDAPYTFINDLHREIERIGRKAGLPVPQSSAGIYL